MCLGRRDDPSDLLNSYTVLYPSWRILKPIYYHVGAWWTLASFNTFQQLLRYITIMTYFETYYYVGVWWKLVSFKPFQQLLCFYKLQEVFRNLSFSACVVSISVFQTFQTVTSFYDPHNIGHILKRYWRSHRLFPNDKKWESSDSNEWFLRFRVEKKNQTTIQGHKITPGNVQNIDPYY